MELTFENFMYMPSCSIQLATGEDNNITEIAGDNETGKSSVLNVLKALATKEYIPIPKVLKKDANLLVTYGEKKAKASLKWQGGEIEGKWPNGKITGSKFHVSKYAAGILNPVNIPSKDLAAALQILPTYDEFANEMKGIIENQQEAEEYTKGYWAKIEVTNKEGEVTYEWDKASAHAISKRQELKRDWAVIAGQDWTEQSKNFAPAAFVNEPLETLQQSLQSAQKIYEHAIKSEALNEKANTDLKGLAAQAPQPAGDGSAQAKVDEIQNQITSVVEELETNNSMLKAVPDILNVQKTYKCWNCEALGCLQGNDMVKPQNESSKEERDAAQQKINEFTKKIGDLQHKRDDLNLSLRQAKIHAETCANAVKQLSNVVLDAPPVVSVLDALKEVDACRSRVEAHHNKIKLDELDVLIRAIDGICAILDEKGLRQDVLFKKLADFNELLKTICQVAGWGLIYVDDFLSVRYKYTDSKGVEVDLPYFMASDARQAACNVVLQVALAKLDGSKMLIFDGIDKFRDTIMSGLEAILALISIPVVIGCAYDNKSQVKPRPNVTTYWCENQTIGLLQYAGVN